MTLWLAATVLLTNGTPATARINVDYFCSSQSALTQINESLQSRPMSSDSLRIKLRRISREGQKQKIQKADTPTGSATGTRADRHHAALSGTLSNSKRGAISAPTPEWLPARE